MPTIARLKKKLTRDTPGVVTCPGVSVRGFAGPSDIDAWLRIRQKAFSQQVQHLKRKPWTVKDFQREFTNKPWWSPRRMWFAEAGSVDTQLMEEQFAETSTGGGRDSIGPGRFELVGSVCLAFFGRGPRSTPFLHWLMVVPEWQRRGIGHLLAHALEQQCREDGYTEIQLETRTDWDAAMKFYRRLGYR